MNRTELCARIAARSSLSRADAASAVDAVVSAISDALESGEVVNIAGFGRFSTRRRAARQGRNPRTGEAVAIPAQTVPTFKAGKKRCASRDMHRVSIPLGHDPSGVAREHPQQLELGGGELERATAQRHPASVIVDGELAEHEGLGVGPAAQRAPARRARSARTA